MYPLIPKSTAKMEAGQFWPIHLKNGQYACGVVVAIVNKENGKRDSRTFLAGLLDWSGTSAPDNQEIYGRKLLEKGFAHIKTITNINSCIIGKIEPKWNYPKIMKQADNIRSWGYNVINLLSEKYFG
jgi:hypothetical protein